VRWKGTFETEGWRNPKTGEARPEIHKSVAYNKDEQEVKEYRYGRDGSFKSYKVKDPENDGSVREVDPELTEGTTDALTATLAVLERIAEGGKCEGSKDVFDGKRRYALIFTETGRVTLEKTRYNVYSGPAAECIVEVKPVAGDWHKKPRGWMSIQEQGRDRGTMPTIWIAEMADGAPAVPVKVRVKTQYGTLFMHLTGYKNADVAYRVSGQK